MDASGLHMSIVDNQFLNCDKFDVE
jgi:hypothetical protein